VEPDAADVAKEFERVIASELRETSRLSPVNSPKINFPGGCFGSVFFSFGVYCSVMGRPPSSYSRSFGINILAGFRPPDL